MLPGLTRISFQWAVAHSIGSWYLSLVTEHAFWSFQRTFAFGYGRRFKAEPAEPASGLFSMQEGGRTAVTGGSSFPWSSGNEGVL